MSRLLLIDSWSRVPAANCPLGIDRGIERRHTIRARRPWIGSVVQQIHGDIELTIQDGERSLQWRIDASEVGEHDYLLCVNMGWSPVEFLLQPPGPGTHWIRIVDTATWAEPDGNCWPAGAADPIGSRYVVHPYAMSVFQESA